MEKFDIHKLMIGDWVSVRNYPYRVTSVLKDGIYTQHGDMSNYYVKAEFVGPIELTDRMLVKNNLANQDSKVYVNHWFEFALVVDDDFIGVSVKYVHQLQQLLRLLDMDDLDKSFEP